MIDGEAIDELVDWMIDGARPGSDARQSFDAIGRRLVGAGMPIGRFEGIEEALARIRESVAMEGRFLELAQTDDDLAPIRDDPSFPRP